MSISSRAILAAFVAPIALVACTASQTGTLSLTQIQAEAVAINNGLQASNTIFQASTTATPNQKAIAAQAAKAAATATAEVQALTTTTTLKAAINAFVPVVQQGVTALAPILAINPATGAAISLGLGLLQAFANGVAAPQEFTGVGARLVPVPVPLPTRATR